MSRSQVPGAPSILPDISLNSLQVTSVTKAFGKYIVPIVTALPLDATAATGEIVFFTSDTKYHIFTGTVWEVITSA
jgi:hypothetical protein